MTYSQFIREGNLTVYVEVNNGEINFLTRRVVPDHLVTIPNIEPQEVIGRTKEIKKLKSLIEKSAKVVLVNGLGGIGKTTLAKAFMQSVRSDYLHMAYIEVGKNVKESFLFNTQLTDSLVLRDELRELATDINFIDRGFELVINRMRQLKGSPERSNNLLVIDNVSEDIEHTHTLDHISLKPDWKVLVTSREKLDGFLEFELGFLSAKDSRRLFYLYYKLAKKDDIIDLILQTVDYHTLTIEIIAKTSQSLRLLPDQILDRLKKKGLNISNGTPIKLKHNQNQRLNNVYKYILSVFDISGLSIYERWILMQFAVLPSRHILYQDDDGENIINLLQIGKDKDRFTNALSHIVEKGWLLWDKKNDSFKLHQVIQEVIITRTKPNTKKCKKLIEQLSLLLRPIRDQNPLLYVRWVGYAETVIEKLMSDEENIANLSTWIGNTFEVLAEYQKLLKYDLISLRIREKTLDSLSPLLANSYHNLGLTYVYLKQYDEALTYTLKALGIRKEVLDKNDTYIARSYISLNFLYEKKLDFKKAIKFGRKAARILEIALRKEKDHEKSKVIQLDLARNHNNLGFDYQHIGSYDLGILYQLKAIDIREKLLSPTDPYLAESYQNAAMAYHDAGDLENAKLFIERAWKIRKDSLPENHEQRQLTETWRKTILLEL